MKTRRRCAEIPITAYTAPAYTGSTKQRGYHCRHGKTNPACRGCFVRGENIFGRFRDEMLMQWDTGNVKKGDILCL